jgi:hypothetical protein
MRIWLAFFALLIGGCNGTENTSNGDRPHKTPTGWEYRPSHGAYDASLSYVDGSRETKFFGSCNGEPVFFLMGGNYQAGATEFTLTVDDRSWRLPAWQGEHGRGLWVDRREQELAIANAKHHIVFQVGDWRSEIYPSPELTRFVSDCS